jgi:hypothetical protein
MLYTRLREAHFLKQYLKMGRIEEEAEEIAAHHKLHVGYDLKVNYRRSESRRSWPEVLFFV